jgi:hypothetical protein
MRRRGFSRGTGGAMLDAGLKVLDLTGLRVSRAFLEQCREDFILNMGMTPEEWDKKVTREVMEWFKPTTPPKD